MSKVIDITFTGKDYSRISDAEYCVNNAVSTYEGEIIDKYWNRILKLFLLSINDSADLFVNHSRYSSKKYSDSYNLFFYYDKDMYFDGVVGFISRKGFSLSLKDITDTNKDLIVSTDELENMWIFNIRLNIISRFDEIETKPFFLMTMLMGEGLRFNDDSIPANMEELCELFLIVLFKEYLKRSLLKGFFKSYVNIKAKDDNIRGSVDINEYIRTYTGNNTVSIPYKFRTKSYNNMLNRLIVEVYLYLRNKYPKIILLNLDSDKLIHDAIQVLMNITSNYKGDIIKDNFRPISHPYFYEYEKLRKLCLKILNRSGMSLWGQNLNEEIQGITFYVPDLWELYLEREIKKKIRKTAVSIVAQGGSTGIAVLQKNETYLLNTYPDFVFYENNIPFAVLDAKFKPAWDSLLLESEDNRMGIILDDYTKCIRDMNSINGHITGVIYPTKVKQNENDKYYDIQSIKHRISRYNSYDSFLVFPVFVPNALKDESYDEWIKRYIDSVGNAMNAVDDILLNMLKRE